MVGERSEVPTHHIMANMPYTTTHDEESPAKNVISRLSNVKRTWEECRGLTCFACPTLKDTSHSLVGCAYEGNNECSDIVVCNKS